ncbi:MAG: D-alanyl-D-alanine carboxypeptidase DacB [Candidatus Celerinatantimonas neptuna]|nr:MAG: D-alanyl-D-alanine carboxypeptidase DacB [Candidatus Celerinatantimonas neptuna]
MRLVTFFLISVFSLNVSYAAVSVPPGALVITQSSWQHQNLNFLAKPASLMKLITTTVAWQKLGPEFRFKTVVHYQRQARYRGRIQMIFNGDPSLTIDDLIGLFHQIKQLGIREITKLDVDDSHYSGHQWGNGQTWNDHGICFAAPVTAIIIGHNCLRGNLTPTYVGQPTRLYVDNFAGIHFTNHVITGRASNLECEPLHSVTTNNHFVLNGCLPSDKKILPLAFSVINVRDYLNNILQQIFKRQHIKWNGKIHFQKIVSPYPAFVVHRSAPLKHLLHHMLKDSDNVYADSLFKQLAYRFGDGKGNYQNGAKVVWDVLASHHIAKRNQVMMDGSGLSRENLIYAGTIYQIIQLWLHNKKFAPLIQDLPIAGQDGTLKYRHSVLIPSLIGKVHAKTGSMQGVSNLAGYINVNGHLKPFVLMTNQVANDDPKQDAIDTMEQFERAWLLKGANH